VRWVRKPAANDANKSKEELAELGEVLSENSLSPEPKSQDVQGQRRTAGGVSHGDRFNDVGQPVFDYQPSNEGWGNDSRNTNNPENTEDGPDFGIDSEPLGKQEHEEVEEEDADPNEYRNWWARIRAKHPEPLAEFLAVWSRFAFLETISLSKSTNKVERRLWGFS
jgi:aquaglyceroporin related protein